MYQNDRCSPLVYGKLMTVSRIHAMVWYRQAEPDVDGNCRNVANPEK